MRLLNIGCGAVRPGDPWTNLDNLHAVLLPGTPERTNLDAEPNYVNADIAGGIPLPDDTFDGILLSHVVEHFDCMGAVALLKECHRVLKPGGAVLVSVPDASRFRAMHGRDTVENAQELFGEPINLADGETTFFGYALFYREHRQVLTEDALWCLLTRAGLDTNLVVTRVDDTIQAMVHLLNRRKFSLEMAATK